MQLKILFAKCLPLCPLANIDTSRCSHAKKTKKSTSLAQHSTVVSLLLTYWRYSCLVLNHWLFQARNLHSIISMKLILNILFQPFIDFSCNSNHIIAVIQLLAIRSLQIFAHAMTAQLLYCWQNCVGITEIEFGANPNIISMHLDCDWKISSEMDPRSSFYPLWWQKKGSSWDQTLSQSPCTALTACKGTVTAHWHLKLVEIPTGHMSP